MKAPRAWVAALLLASAAVGAQPERVSRLGEYRGYAPVLYSETVRTSSYFRLVGSPGTELEFAL